MVTSEFLGPAIPELRSTLRHYASDWFLSFTTETALVPVTVIVSLHVGALRYHIRSHKRSSMPSA